MFALPTCVSNIHFGSRHLFPPHEKFGERFALQNVLNTKAVLLLCWGGGGVRIPPRKPHRFSIGLGAALRGGGGGRGEQQAAPRTWEKSWGVFLGGGACCFSTGMTTAYNSASTEPRDTLNLIMRYFCVVASGGNYP
jgi:hypothetical protein